MPMAYNGEIKTFDEIIMELDHEHIYGYRDGEAVEIVPPHAFNFSVSFNYIKHKMRGDKQWVCSHKSKLEERYTKVGEEND